MSLTSKVATGDVISLLCPSNGFRTELLVECVGENLLLAELTSPYDRLRVVSMPDNSLTVIQCGGPPTRGSFFQLLEQADGKYCFLSSVKANGQERQCALSLSVHGRWIAVERSPKINVELNPSPSFLLRVKRKGSIIDIGLSLITVTKWEIRRFVLEGYLILPKVVDIETVATCSAYLNHELGKPGKVVAGGIQDGLGKLSGDASNNPAIRAAFTARVQSVVDAFMGADCYEKTNLSAQVALRFPEGRESTAQSGSLVWHTDGLRQGQSHGFSLLLGVCLSDVVAPNQGNLAVWPGSHLLLHQCKVPPHGALDTARLRALTLQNECFSNFRSDHMVCEKQPPTMSSLSPCAPSASPLDHHDNEPALPSLGPEHQLLLRAGDVVVLHPDLAHAGAPNLHCEVRRMLYFRLKRRVGKGAESALPGWEALVREHEKDLFCDLPGVTQALGQKELQALLSIYHDS